VRPCVPLQAIDDGSLKLVHRCASMFPVDGWNGALSPPPSAAPILCDSATEGSSEPADDRRTGAHDRRGCRSACLH
jgi:hypothetical protein